nr:hypothetical protein [Tanacetum cinerariifolium]
MSARIAEAASLSLSFFRKRYRSSYKTSSSSSTLTDESLDADDERERESQGLDDDGHGLCDEDHGLDEESHGLEDEALGLEEEEAVLEGHQLAVLVVEIGASGPLGLGYRALRHHDLAVGEDQTLPSPEWSLGSLLVSPSSPIVPSPIASLVATSIAMISVDEDQFIKLVDTDTKSYQEEAPSELQLLGSRVPLMSKEFEASKPSGFSIPIWDLKNIQVTCQTPALEECEDSVWHGKGCDLTCMYCTWHVKGCGPVLILCSNW